MTDQLGTLQALFSTRWGLVLPLDVAYSSSKSHWFNSLQHLQGEKQTDQVSTVRNKPTRSIQGETQINRVSTGRNTNQLGQYREKNKPTGSIQGRNKPTRSGEKQMSQYFTAFTRENTTRTKFYSFKRENTMMMFYSINWGKTINQINALQHLLWGKPQVNVVQHLLG